MVEWRPVVGYEHAYLVSNEGGLVRSAHGPGAVKGRELRGTVGDRGYVKVTLAKGGYSKVLRLHRLVTEAFLGPCPTGMMVNHKNGNKLDNRLENLEYVTHAQNVKHAMEHRMYKHGEKHWRSVLNEETVRMIRSSPKSTAGLARELGVNEETVRDVRLGRSWKHVA